MGAIVFRNGTLDRNTGRNVKRSADVSGNARHFCDCELNYTEFEPNSPNSTTTGYEGERSGTNHWTDMTQGTRNESCGHIRKWTSALWAWVQLKGCEPKRHQQICWCPFCILTSLLIVSQISFECDCRFRLFYGVGQSLHYIYARSSQRSSLSIHHLQKF